MWYLSLVSLCFSSSLPSPPSAHTETSAVTATEIQAVVADLQHMLQLANSSLERLTRASQAGATNSLFSPTAGPTVRVGFSDVLFSPASSDTPSASLTPLAAALGADQYQEVRMV